MLYIFGSFIKRIPREKYKSLSASFLALVLVFLISTMYGTRDRQTAELDNVIKNFEVRVELSHPISRATEGLTVREPFIDLFTDEDVPFSLARLVRDTELRWKYTIYDPAEVRLYRELTDQWRADLAEFFDIADPMILDWATLVSAIPPPLPPVVLGEVYSITSLRADTRFDPAMGVFIDFIEGYDETVFRTSEPVAVVSDRLYDELNPENPVIKAVIWSEPLGDWTLFAEIELLVVGIIHGADVNILAPFFSIGESWSAATRRHANSEIMNAIMSDNKMINAFKSEASERFVTTGVLSADKPYALTVFDGTYNDLVSNLRQNISLIGIATPFVFGLSVCIGFIASFLLTRRRKAEFAIMRSIGVRKAHVFFGALAEQFTLCVMGAAAGCLLYAAVRREFMAIPAVIFTVCYTLGTIITAARAAGTDVLKILRDREQA